MNYFRRRIQALLTACTALLVCVAAAQETPDLPYMNIKLSPEERAADLAHRMTLEEKASSLAWDLRLLSSPHAVAYILPIRPRANAKLRAKGMIEIRHVSEARI